jgi:hypothetical protein
MKPSECAGMQTGGGGNSCQQFLFSRPETHTLNVLFPGEYGRYSVLATGSRDQFEGEKG